MLTVKQEAVLNFIRQFQRDERVPPSSRIIKSKFKFKAQNSVMQYLAALATKGFIEKYADGRWGVKNIGIQAHLFELPVMGDIPAGLPAINEQVDGEKIGIDLRILGIKNPRLDRFFALRVKGDSMIGANIVSGDLAICEWCEPRVGDVIAALVDDTTVTLKQLVSDGERLLLRAANANYEDIKPDRLEGQGVVRGIIRSSVALTA